MDFEKMNKRVEIQEQTETKVARGDVSRGWETVMTVWASIEPLTGRELFYAQQVHAEANTRITMRHYADLTAKHRLKFGSRIYQIIAPPKNINEKGSFDEILAVEVAA